jgi:cystathionine beta-synthase
MQDKFSKDDVVVVIFHDHGTRYLGKMFNDDWMRDRGFLLTEQTRAINLIETHKHQKLVTVKTTDTVGIAVQMMKKFSISQLPVTNENENFVGSLTDTALFGMIMENHELKQKLVAEVMSISFPFVDAKASLEEVSRLITKDNAAVLVKDLMNQVHIITKQDLIEAIS